MRKVIIFSIAFLISLNLHAQEDSLKDLKITYPNKTTKIKSNDNLIILWEYPSTNPDKKVNISLSFDNKETWKLLEADVSLKNLHTKINLDGLKIKGSENCFLKFEENLTTSKESEKFEITGDTGLDAPYFVSTGFNLSYASDEKVNGIYFSVTSSLQRVLFENSYLDVLLAQGKTQTEVVNELTQNSQTNKLTLKTDNYNVYAIASFKHKSFLKQVGFIFPQIELRVVKRKINEIQTLKPASGDEVTIKNETHDEVLFQQIAGTGIGHTFKNSFMKLDLDLILGYSFSSDERLMHIARFNLKTLFGINIGGEIRSYFKGLDHNPSNQNEILIYISKDINIDALVAF